MKSNCRICKTDTLEIKFDLGNLKYTGVFPEINEKVKEAPIRLAICKKCDFVQLYDQLDPSEFYKEGYGYESDLNSSMKKHLVKTATTLEDFFNEHIGEIGTVLDIASNDGTLLNGYKGGSIKKIGIDPIIKYVNNKYPTGAIKISEFFSSEAVKSIHPEPVDIVTSLSVFYDLDDPIEFANNVFEILSDNGIWYLEQSYLPAMLEASSYDTICHEHLNYYSLSILQLILSQSGFKIINATTNNINGGSIAITAAKIGNQEFPNDSSAEILLQVEKSSNHLGEEALSKFAKNSQTHMNEFRSLLVSYKQKGYQIFGLGASTKGNVLLQCSKIDSNLMSSIGEINPRKFGKFTPGTLIPIVDEKSILDSNSEKKVLVIIPWHFQDSIIPYLEEFLNNGGIVVVPLPKLNVISR